MEKVLIAFTLEHSEELLKNYELIYKEVNSVSKSFVEFSRTVFLVESKLGEIQMRDLLTNLMKRNGFNGKTLVIKVGDCQFAGHLPDPSEEVERIMIEKILCGG